MANEVTMTFAGDESKLTDSMKKVGQAADGMGKKIADIEGSTKKANDGLDNMVDKADTVDTRAMGFRDTITGVQDTLKGLSDDSLSTGDKLLTLGMGVGDLASGFANFLIPALGQAVTWLASTTVGTWAVTAAQTAWAAITRAVTVATTALNLAMRANPILFVVGLILALVIAFKVLWERSEGFRNFFIGMWNGIKTVVGNVVTWIKGAWNGVMDFFSKMPGRIKGFFVGFVDGIKSIFKSIVNAVIDLLNGGIGLINSLIHGINNVSGVVGIPAIPDIPRIPRLHTGGVSPNEQLTILQAGEKVIPRGQQGNQGTTVSFANGLDSAFAVLIMKMIRNGDIQIAT